MPGSSTPGGTLPFWLLDPRQQGRRSATNPTQPIPVVPTNGRNGRKSQPFSAPPHLNSNLGPETGKRVSRLNPDSGWIVQNVPGLRLIDQELRERVKMRQG